MKLVRATWVVLWASLGVLFFYALERSHGRYTAVMTPVVVLLALAMGALLLHLFLRNRFLCGLRHKNHYSASVTGKLTVEELGLRLSLPHRESMIRWPGWDDIEDLGDLILLWVQCQLSIRKKNGPPSWPMCKSRSVPQSMNRPPKQ